MSLKNVFFGLSAAVLVLSTTTAFAADTVTYPFCAVSGCSQSADHTHDGVYYAGHTVDDGHYDHAICTVQGCTLTAGHTHDDGFCYQGHSRYDGHSYCGTGRFGGHHGGGRGRHC